MEWVIAILLTMNFALVIAIFWFWKWSIQRMQTLETNIVRLKYQDALPKEKEENKELQKILLGFKAELEQLQAFQKAALPILERVKNEPRFEESEQEIEIKRVLGFLQDGASQLPKEKNIPAPMETFFTEKSNASLKNLFASA